MSICTQCGGREIWSYKLMGESGPMDHYCEKCGKTDIADTPSGAMEVVLRRESELRQRIAELESALVDLISWTSVDMVELQREGHTVSHLAASVDRAQQLLEGGK
jgi:hypothetical protein